MWHQEPCLRLFDALLHDELSSHAYAELRERFSRRLVQLDPGPRHPIRRIDSLPDGVADVEPVDVVHWLIEYQFR